MFDVHPPEHAPHSGRDFFTHIATIVIGLLIAVGLEQAIESWHQRHLMHQAREHIRSEVEVNQRVFRTDQQEMEQFLVRMNRNLDILRSRNSPHADPAATLDFSWNVQNFFDAAYSGAKDSGALSRMPYEESATYEDAYTGVTMSTDAMLDLIKHIYAAEAFLHGRRLADLSPAEAAALETSLSDIIGKAEYYKLHLDLEHQEWDAILSGHFRTDIRGTGK